MSHEHSQQARGHSHGRGGAGNFGSDPRDTHEVRPEDLVTPTIKSDMYTTGRGGTGNMAKNLKEYPEYSRAAQDVGGQAPRDLPNGNYHYGRGGAANVIQVGPVDGESRKSRDLQRPPQQASEHPAEKGLLGKGKDLLQRVTGGSGHQEAK